MVTRLLISWMILVLILSGCAFLPGRAENPDANMANPASVYCQEQSGRLETRLDASGGQFGVCIFADGSECEEWSFFRGECQPGDYKTVPGPTLRPAYVNDDYRFSFNPPDSWSIEGERNLLKFRQKNYILWVQFGRSDETFMLRPAPGPELERLEAPPARLLGQDLPKWIVTGQGKVKRVDYPAEILIGEHLRLSAWLGYDDSLPIDPEQFEMPDEIMAEADAILDSFTLTSGETPHITYEGP